MSCGSSCTYRSVVPIEPIREVVFVPSSSPCCPAPSSGAGPVVGTVGPSSSVPILTEGFTSGTKGPVLPTDILPRGFDGSRSDVSSISRQLESLKRKIDALGVSSGCSKKCCCCVEDSCECVTVDDVVNGMDIPTGVEPVPRACLFINDGADAAAARVLCELGYDFPSVCCRPEGTEPVVLEEPVGDDVGGGDNNGVIPGGPDPVEPVNVEPPVEPPPEGVAMFPDDTIPTVGGPVLTEITSFLPSHGIPGGVVSDPWDGVPLDPTVASCQDLVEHVFPGGGDVMRGLTQLYDSVVPFVDPSNPTDAEIQDWFFEVVNLFRRLLGQNTPAVPLRKLFLTSHWSSERNVSGLWDAAYPSKDPYSDDYGPCNPKGVGHCGNKFKPNASDQQSYLRPGESVVTGNNYGEGIYPAWVDYPWSLRLSKTLRYTMGKECYTGHIPSWVNATYYGFSYFKGPDVYRLRVHMIS
jgi:hypothetical protein